MQLERAFVAGATGYTGREVVSQLRARGVETLAHVRPDSPQLEEWRRRFEALGAVVDTTPWEPQAMRETLARIGPSAVFALLGTTRSRVSRARRQGRDPARETYEAVDYALTHVLIAAAETVNPLPRFVYLSAMGVSPGSRNSYYAVRARIERELVESTLPFVVARPAMLTGPDRDETRLAERAFGLLGDVALGAIGLVGARKTRDRWRSMDAATLARALIRLAEDDTSVGRVVQADGLRS